MIKIKISYTDPKDKIKVIDALRGLKILKIGKEQIKKRHKNIHIEVE